MRERVSGASTQREPSSWATKLGVKLPCNGNLATAQQKSSAVMEYRHCNTGNNSANREVGSSSHGFFLACLTVILPMCEGQMSTVAVKCLFAALDVGYSQ